MKNILNQFYILNIILTGCLACSCSSPLATGFSGSSNKKSMPDTIKIAYGRPAEIQAMHSVNISSASNPEILSSWLFDFSNSSLTVCGISDPHMDSLDAKELAQYRALALAALLGSSKVDNVTEAYYRDLSQNRLVTTQFNSLSKISAAIAINPAAFMVLEESHTSAGEKLVKINYQLSQTKASDSLVVDAEVFYSETPLSAGDRIYTYFKISAFLKSKNGNNKKVFIWESHLDNGRLEFVSTFKGGKVEFPVRYRYYSAPQNKACNSEPDPDFYQNEDMGYGLWNAYAIAILRNIDLLEKEFTDIKAITDNYGGQAEFLTREISSNTVSFLIESACTANNRLYLRMKQK
jgi:hypothetical protein